MFINMHCLCYINIESKAFILVISESLWMLHVITTPGDPVSHPRCVEVAISM